MAQRSRTVAKFIATSRRQVFAPAPGLLGRRAFSEETVMTNNCRTAQLGELIAAAFDEAARYTTDPERVSYLATQAVQHILRRAPKASAPKIGVKTAA
jgi:hypothetical protein